MFTQLDYFKNDVFSLGLTFLHAMSLENISNFNYNYKFLSQRIKEIEELKDSNDQSLYDKDLIFIIKNMLNYDQNNRPSF